MDNFCVMFERASRENGSVENVDFWIDKLESFISSEITKARKEAQEEYKLFVLNVLDGIDQADKENVFGVGGTRAIRLALQSRII